MDINYNNIINRVKLNNEYEKALKSRKILYVSANVGFGKTISVLNWMNIKHKTFSYATAGDESFFEEIEKDEFKKKYIVLDDISFLQTEEEKELLLKYICETEAKFVLIGRNELPSFLKTMRAIGQVICVDKELLAFDENETRELLDLVEAEVSERNLRRIIQDTYGMPLAIMLIAKRIKNNRYTQQTYEEAKKDFFDCLDYALYRQLTETQRIIVLNLVSVEHFDIELATMLTGMRNIEMKIKEISDFGSIFKSVDGNEYCFIHPVLREYFLEKQKKKLSGETILQLYQKAGLYYELRGNVLKALEYYDKGGNSDKLSELLIENTKQNGVSANFYQTEKYYNTLSEEQIRESPELMCGMSMLNSICLRPEESEKWYNHLKEFSENIDKRDGRYKTARDKLLYLDMGLPHRGTNNLAGIVQKISAIFITKRISIQEISPTGNMPSILNGGKDYCQWSRNDRIFCKAMKKPFALVLGECGVGIADGGLGESLFEKTTDLNFTEPLSYLNRALAEVSTHGNILMRFAILGVMSRIFVASGNSDSAIEMIESFRDTLDKEADPILMNNIDAWLVALNLFAGDKEIIEQWMRESAPNEFLVFYSNTRLRFLVKTKIYILEGRYTEALSLITRLQEYYINYERTYGYIQSKILLAIVHYRMNEDSWETELSEAIELCEEYQFVRIVADEGIAILEPLSKLNYKGNEEFYKILLNLTRTQAVNYPMYLVKKDEVREKLTDMEKNVLKLMTQGLTNERIAEILGISLRTVKYHAANIYSKMGVKNRAGAIARVKGYLD